MQSEPEVRPDRIVREAFLDATPTEVWRSLTRPEELARWLGSRVELDPRRGGVLRVESEVGVWRGVVEAVRRHEYLAFRWRPFHEDPDTPLIGPGTRVEFFLEPEGDGTRLRLVETLLSAPATGSNAPRGRDHARSSQAVALSYRAAER
jgi:uncharacterized protein YndB with AHSA1/START domain